MSTPGRSPAHHPVHPGALLTLLACGMELSIIAVIGIILLIGIVKRNANLFLERWRLRTVSAWRKLGGRLGGQRLLEQISGGK
jgi:hypothetical protein